MAHDFNFTTQKYVTATEPVTVVTIPALLDNYVYLITWNGHAAVIDPADAEPVQQYVQAHDLALESILNTHHHYDHVAGNAALKAAHACRVIGPANPGIPGLDQSVGEGDRLQVGPLELEVLATPGHGDTDISFHAELLGDPEQGLLWCGDTLFCGGCGRLMEGTAQALWASLQRLAGLAPGTQVYCGHEYTEDNLTFASHIEPHNPAVQIRLEAVRALRKEGRPTVPSTMALETVTNPFLRAGTEEMMAYMGMTEPFAAFAELRARKDRF